MISDERIEQHPSFHFRTLGICWGIYGIFRIIVGVWQISFTNNATLMFGSLLNRVPNPLALMNDFHLLYTGAIVLSFVCGVLGVIAGLALVAEQRAGRSLALVAGFLSLSNLPFGIMLGVYTLVVLLPLREFHTSSASVRSRATEFRSHASTT